MTRQPLQLALRNNVGFIALEAVVAIAVLAVMLTTVQTLLLGALHRSERVAKEDERIQMLFAINTCFTRIPDAKLAPADAISSVEIPKACADMRGNATVQPIQGRLSALHFKSRNPAEAPLPSLLILNLERKKE